jgi:hypothetical protein
MKFNCPASVTTTGWIEIDAPNIEEAKKIARQKNKDGIDQDDLNDTETSSEVHVDEIDYQAEGDKPYAEASPRGYVRATALIQKIRDFAAKRVGSAHAETIHGGRSHCPTCGWVDELDRTNPVVLEWHGDSFETS